MLCTSSTTICLHNFAHCPRACLQLLLLCTCCSFSLAASDASCMFSIHGNRRGSGNVSSVVSASAACIGREAVQLQVAQSLIPYINNFTDQLALICVIVGCIGSLRRITSCWVGDGMSAIMHERHLHAFVGVNVTVVTAHDTTIPAPDGQYSALFAIQNVTLTIYDSSFTNLDLAAVQAPMALDRSAVTILNTDILDNTAPLSGGIASSAMSNLTLSNCTFNNNYGELNALPATVLWHVTITAQLSLKSSCCQSLPPISNLLRLELWLTITDCSKQVVRRELCWSMGQQMPAAGAPNTVPLPSTTQPLPTTPTLLSIWSQMASTLTFSVACLWATQLRIRVVLSS